MGLLSGISGALFGSPDTGASEATHRRAQELAEKAGLIFEDLDAPTQQELIDSLRYLEDVPYEEAVELGPSGMEVLQADPELVAQQKKTLGKLGQIGDEGLTAEDVYEREQLMDRISGNEQARQKAIQREMAERGVDNSGIEIASRLQSSQSSANRARQEGQALEAEKYRRALQGITAAGSLAGQMRGQEFGEGAQKASAADQIAQFNALQRGGVQQRNIAQQRGIAAQKATTRQQAYDNEMRKRQAQAGAYSGAAQQATQQAAGQQQAALQEHSAGTQLFGSLAGAAASAFVASDINAKENIESAKPEIDNMMENLDAASYDYKEPEKFGEGRQIGVMAQDLEKSKLGDQFTEDDIDGEGTKGINYGKMAPTLLASQVEQHKETKDLKTRVGELEALLNAFRGKGE